MFSFNNETIEENFLEERLAIIVKNKNNYERMIKFICREYGEYIDSLSTFWNDAIYSENKFNTVLVYDKELHIWSENDEWLDKYNYTKMNFEDCCI